MDELSTSDEMDMVSSAELHLLASISEGLSLCGRWKEEFDGRVPCIFPLTCRRGPRFGRFKGLGGQFPSLSPDSDSNDSNSDEDSLVCSDCTPEKTGVN